MSPERRRANETKKKNTILNYENMRSNRKTKSNLMGNVMTDDGHFVIE